MTDSGGCGGQTGVELMSSRGGRPDAAVVAALGCLLGVPDGSVGPERLAELLMLASVAVPRAAVRGLYFWVGVQVRRVNVDQFDRLLNEEAGRCRVNESQ